MALNSGSSTNDADKKRKVRVSNSAFSRLVFNTAVRWIGMTFAALAVVYLCFAVTLLRVVLIGDGSLVPVKNPTFVGSVVPSGSRVVVDPSRPHDGGIIDHMRQAFLPSRKASVVDVLAGPYGRLSWAEPILTVDGKAVSSNVSSSQYSAITKDRESQFLQNEYVVKCVKGDCTPGEVFIVSSNSVTGELLIGQNDN